MLLLNRILKKSTLLILPVYPFPAQCGSFPPGGCPVAATRGQACTFVDIKEVCQEDNFLVVPCAQIAYSFGPPKQEPHQKKRSSWPVRVRAKNFRCSRDREPHLWGLCSLVYTAPWWARGHVICFSSKQIHSHTTPNKEEKTNVCVIDASCISRWSTSSPFSGIVSAAMSIPHDPIPLTQVQLEVLTRGSKGYSVGRKSAFLLLGLTGLLAPDPTGPLAAQPVFGFCNIASQYIFENTSPFL